MSPVRPGGCLLVLAGLLSSPGVEAQTRFRTLTSRELWPEFTNFDPELLVLADLNGDGEREIGIGDLSFRFPDMVSPWGKMTVLDGATGEELFGQMGEIGLFQTPDNIGFRLADLGDVNGDGVRDLLGGCLFGQARVWSGKDGAELYRSPGAVETVAALGDLDRDGIPDLGLRRTVAPFGVIEVRAGGSFELLYTVQPPFASHLFGYSIVSLGDVDADGIPDFAVGAPDNAWIILSDDCHETFVFVFSGRDGRHLFTIAGERECEHLGYTLAAPGDLDGDGIGDLVIGAAEIGRAGPGEGRLFFHSGRTGQRIGEVALPGFHHSFARALSAVGDANGNGFPDLLVSSVASTSPGSLTDRGEAWLVDGGTREFLYRLRGDPSLDVALPAYFGLAAVGLGDVDDDEFPDFLVGTPGLRTWLGRLDWFSGAPEGVRVIGRSGVDASHTAPRIGASGVPRIGSPYAIHLARVPPGQKAFLVVRASAPGAASARGGRSPRGSGSPLPSQRLIPAVTTPAAGKEGAATVRIPLANDPGLVGATLVVQWIVFGVGGMQATRELEITIQASESPGIELESAGQRRSAPR